MAETADRPRCGIVVHDRGDRAEELLAAFVAGLDGRPLRVGGMYQVTEPTADGTSVMSVVDIATGRRLRISQNLGKGSSSCCLDPSALAEAAMILRRAIDARVDLLVANKFAGSEIEGGGIAAEVFAALSDGIPVLTLVAERYLDGWRALSGGIGEELPPTLEALEAWLADALPAAARKEQSP